MAILIRRGIIPAAGAAPDSTAYLNFIARTSGLDATHTAAYRALLNGLTADGLFNSDGTSSYFDVLYITATQDAATANLNLVNSSFGLGNFNSGSTFTADQGLLGTATNNFTDTNYNPSSNATNFSQDNCHISVWNYTNATDANLIVGVQQGVTNQRLGIIFFNGDSSVYAYCNENTNTPFSGVTDYRGHWVANRTSSTARQLYQNASTTAIGGTSLTYGSVASSSPPNISVALCGYRLSDGTTFFGNTTQTVCAASIGASLTPAQVTNFYNRLRTYMTAVGVP